MASQLTSCPSIEPVTFPHTDALSLSMWLWLGLAVVAMVVLFFVDAPYGRRSRAGWGPGIPNRLAWFLMEAVVLVAFSATLGARGWSLTAPTWVMAGLFTLHYVNRALIYPWRTRTKGKTMPLATMLLSMGFNSVNGFFLGSELARANRPDAWLTDPRFIVGVVVFVAGMVLNWHSDNILLHLRAPGETVYKIPRGGAFRWVTSPNLLGEIVEWLGFALLTWTLAGFTFFAWTCANLIPRARANQRWYHENFADYPPERKTLIPGLW